MHIADLIKEARFDLLDDKVEPYLWSDEQLKRYANEAVLEACNRAPLIKQVYSKAITAAVADYSIDESIRQIYVAKLDLQTRPLGQTTEAELALLAGSTWKTRTGTPTHYIRRGHAIRLFPIPLVSDTLVLSTSNIPDDSFDLDSDIDPAYHKGFLFYIAYKAYLLNDQDAYNPAKAAEYLNMFNAKFGLPKTAKHNSVAFDSPLYGTIISGRMA